MHKWAHYLDVYDRHLSGFRRRGVTVLEIGVREGGSLRMWRDYFGPAATVVGLDIDPRCARLADPDTIVVIGDQGDPEVLRSLVNRFGPFDVVIDDGGHTMAQQASTLDILWPAIREGGVLIVEDLHTSYWPRFGGGVGRDDTFIARLQNAIDSMHARYADDDAGLQPDALTSTLVGLHVYDSIAVLDRGRTTPPEELIVGYHSLGPDATWVGRHMPGMLARLRAVRAATRRRSGGPSSD